MKEDQLKERILCGDTLKQMASLFDTSQTNIRYWLKKFNLKLVRGARGKKPKDFSFPRKCACGELDPFKFYGNKTTICKQCHCKTNLLKGQENRAYILNKLGGKCFNCDFNKWKTSLDVHHLDTSKKDISFSTIRYWKRDKIDIELLNCVLLCRNCHSAFHNGELINSKLSV